MAWKYARNRGYLPRNQKKEIKWKLRVMPNEVKIKLVQLKWKNMIKRFGFDFCMYYLFRGVDLPLKELSDLKTAQGIFLY